LIVLTISKIILKTIYIWGDLEFVSTFFNITLFFKLTVVEIPLLPATYYSGEILYDYGKSKHKINADISTLSHPWLRFALSECFQG